MKNTLYFCILVLLLGCERGEPRSQQQRIVYPALNESPPPPPPPLEGGAETLPQPNKAIPSVITGERWIDLKEDSDDMVKRLRDYAEKADPDDPFALKEEDIRKLAEQEGLRVY